MERRQQILDATERLLRRYGPQKTTIADVAREVGVSVGTIYLDFESKEAIVEALSSSLHQRVLVAMRKAAAAEGASFRDRLRGALDARVETFLALAEDGPHACDLVHCQTVAVRTSHQRFLDDERALLRDLVRRGCDDGELAASKPETCARALLAAYVAFSPPMLFRIPRDEVKASLRALHDVVLFGVVARKKRDRKK